ncbi:hypothetical protein EWM64_g10709, partial [Hericium alpestre]
KVLSSMASSNSSPIPPADSGHLVNEAGQAHVGLHTRWQHLIHTVAAAVILAKQELVAQDPAIIGELLALAKEHGITEIQSRNWGEELRRYAGQAKDPSDELRAAMKAYDLHKTWFKAASADKATHSAKRALALNAEKGFHITPIDDITIYISYDKNKTPHVEAFVIRNVGITEGFEEDCEAVYTFVDNAVQEACSERRNVRPLHQGEMIQLGWNAGARDVYIWGLAVSYTKKRSQDVQKKHDEDVVAVMSLMWSLVHTHIPTDVVDETERIMDNSGMLKLATRTIAAGPGYKFQVNGKSYSFPLAECAPPEGYMVQGYSSPIHVDGFYANMAYSWVTGEEELPAQDPPAAVSVYKTRRQQAQAQASSSTAPSLLSPQVIPEDHPQHFGGNYVDLNLKIIVPQYRGTLMAFAKDRRPVVTG